jgi:hypothetical protein
MAQDVVFTADGYTSEVSLEIRLPDCLLGFTNTLEKFKMVMPPAQQRLGERCGQDRSEIANG